MTARVPGSVDAKKLRAALTAYLEECAEAGKRPASRTADFYQAMEERMETGIGGLDPWARDEARKRFSAQVLRELNLRAGTGELVKRGHRGSLEGVRFYTPQALAEAAAREQAAKEAGLALESRRSQVRRRLEALGLEPDAAGEILLDTGDWETLVHLAERGRRRDNG
jgi:predicted LPLAT superfamily acyltransferase